MKLKRKIENAEKIRIGLFVSGNDGGGVRTSLLNLIHHVDRERFIFYYIACAPGQLVDDMKKLGLTGIVLGRPLPAIKSDPHDAQSGMLFTSALYGIAWMGSRLPGLIRAIQALNLDLLHSHRVHLHVIGGIAAKLVGIRSVWHIRGVLNRRSLRGMAVPVYCMMAKMFGDLLIANSMAVYQSLLQSAQKKTVVVYNGHPIEKIRREQVSRDFWHKFGVPDDALLVGLVGRINPNKGQDFFIRIAKRIAQHRTDIRFIIVGDVAPGQDAYCRWLHNFTRQSNLDKYIVFTGFVEKAYRLYSTFDISTFCTQDTEACPNTVLEAMAAGVPIVATAVGGARELISHDHTGYLVDSKDEEMFSDRLLCLLENMKEAKAMGQKGYHRAVAHFSELRMIRSIEQQYIQLIPSESLA
ncbi:glycosyl transferase, family I [Desulfosarcina variabilis str. Montpellier]|uniref:glycosyltransferase n=1 Tax=Desulfosarcina variabilis TaxID=2300 RepID=UPI003AFA3491